MAKTKKNLPLNRKIASMNKGEVSALIFTRILIIFAVDVIIAYLFDFVKNDAEREFFFHMNVNTPLKYVFGGLLVLSLVYLAITFIKKIDTSAHVRTPGMITALSFFLFVSAMFYDKFRNTSYLFYTIMIIGSVLFILYYIYTLLLYRL